MENEYNVEDTRYRMAYKNRPRMSKSTIWATSLTALAFSMLCFKGIGCAVKHYFPQRNEQTIEQTIEPNKLNLEFRLK